MDYTQMLFDAAGVKGLWVCEPYTLFNPGDFTVYEHSSNFISLHVSSSCEVIQYRFSNVVTFNPAS